MNPHATYHELLPDYVAGQLDKAQRQALESHLAGCAECQADLELWRGVAAEVSAAGRAASAPPALAERALEKIRGPRPAQNRTSPVLLIRRAWLLLRSQAPLVRREIWPASAAVIGLGYLVALLSGELALLRALAPLVAAASLAVLYGPDHDPAGELALSTPTSPRQILLARLALVFGYDLALALAASLALLPALNGGAFGSLTLGGLVLGWLAPMTFLSAAALLLSLWAGAANAITLTYLAWLVRFLPGAELNPPPSAAPGPAQIAQALEVYHRLWENPQLLLALAVLLLAAALWSTGRREPGIHHWS